MAKMTLACFLILAVGCLFLQVSSYVTNHRWIPQRTNQIENDGKSAILGPPNGSRGIIDWRYPDIIVDPLVECLSLGFFQHPRNCSWYYRCSIFNESYSAPFFTRTYYECEPGTVFVHGLQQCAGGSWNKGCPDEPTPPDSPCPSESCIVSIDKSTCTRNYFCEDGIKRDRDLCNTIYENPVNCNTCMKTDVCASNEKRASHDGKCYLVDLDEDVCPPINCECEEKPIDCDSYSTCSNRIELYHNLCSVEYTIPEGCDTCNRINECQSDEKLNSQDMKCYTTKNLDEYECKEEYTDCDYYGQCANGKQLYIKLCDIKYEGPHGCDTCKRTNECPPGEKLSEQDMKCYSTQGVSPEECKKPTKRDTVLLQ